MPLIHDAKVVHKMAGAEDLIRSQTANKAHGDCQKNSTRYGRVEQGRHYLPHCYMVCTCVGATRCDAAAMAA